MAEITELSSAQHRRFVGPGTPAHPLARLAAGIRVAAREEAGVELTQSYAERVAADGAARCDQLGVTKLGVGVVIHTAPDSRGELPVVLGYADRDEQWLRDGSRHGSAEVPH